MQARNGTQLYSASDICNFLECQHLTAEADNYIRALCLWQEMGLSHA